MPGADSPIRVGSMVWRSGWAMFDRHSKGSGQFTETGERVIVRDRGHHVKQSLFGLMRSQRVKKLLPVGRKCGTLEMSGEGAAQLDGLPVLIRRSRAWPPRRSPRRLGLILTGRFRLQPLFRPRGALGLQFAVYLALECVILAGAMRPALLLSHRCLT